MEGQNLNILVVDDDSAVRDAYRQILSDTGLSDITEKGSVLFDDFNGNPKAAVNRKYELTMADCGEAGVAAVEKALRQKSSFAAAFVDMVMPGIDGAETIRRIWRVDPGIKIVIVTAFSDRRPEEITRMLKREDVFYLRKPFSGEEIRQFAAALTKQWNLEREKTLLSAKLERTRQGEMETAARIQRSLLLQDPPSGLEAAEIHHRMIPSQMIDGDFFDFLPMSDSLLDVVVGDVMGKGVQAALVAAGLKNRLMRNMVAFIIAKQLFEIPSVEDIIAALHDQMLPTLERHETFATIVYGRFDFARREFRYVDCGHTRTVHYQKSARTCRLLEGVNMPIGFPEKEAFTSRSVPFASGDIFLFYSDGLTEARNAQGEMYGEDRLVNFIGQHSDAGAKELLDRIFQDVVGFKQSERFADDFTCICIQIKAPYRSTLAIDSGRMLEIASDLKELARARAFVRSFFSESAPALIGRSRVDLFELALNEAVANIINHAYENVPGRPILIEAETTADAVVFRLYDWGLKFDPSAVPQPAFDGTLDHGFGVHIISQAVDEVDYSRDETGKNCTTLSIKMTGGG